MRSTNPVVILAFAVAANAASSCTAAPYYNVAGFPQSPATGCYPTTYSSAFDLGSTNPTDAFTRCGQQCSSKGSACIGFYASINKAADSNLYSGTCFLYPPGTDLSTPRQCANPPSQLLAAYQDNSQQCFSSDTAAATSFCSSYLKIGTSTVYTKTVTPSTTATTHVTTTSKATLTSIVQTVTTTTTTSLSTSVTISTSNAVMQKRAQTPKPVVKAAAASKPSCISSQVPASQLSADCSCLNIPSKTVSAVLTLPTKTVTSTIVSSLTTTVSTSFSTLFTSTTVSTTVQGTTTTTTTVQTSQACPSPAGPQFVNAGFNDGTLNPWTVSGNAVASSDQHYCGSYSAKLNAAAGSAVTLSQTVAGLDPTLNFLVNGHFFVPSDQSASTCYYRVQCNGGSAGSTAYTISFSAGQGWTYFGANCPGGSTTATVTFQLDCTSSYQIQNITPGIMYYDELYFTAYVPG